MEISIIPYTEAFHDAFRDINTSWLNEYGLLESHDIAVLENPGGMIIDKGGAIFLAMKDHTVVGTAAIAKEGEDCVELVKMTVIPAFRGRGISRLLIDRCIAAAKNIGAKRMILFSNSKLTTAIGLYERYGFMHIPVTDSHFETADIKMELSL